jgi:hypothetical protein
MKKTLAFIARFRGLMSLSVYSIAGILLAQFPNNINFGLVFFLTGFFSLLISGYQALDSIWTNSQLAIPRSMYEIRSFSDFMYFMFIPIIWMSAIFLPPIILIKGFKI